MKIGIFGGTFNPPHLGHLNSLQTAHKKMGLEKIKIIPAFKSPLKNETEGPTPKQRLEMTRLAIQDWSGPFEILTLELERKGKSYTVDTLKEISKEHSADDLYLIIGLDQFDQFDKWKKPEEILEMANLIVTSRPGFQFPSQTEELPQSLQNLVDDWSFNVVELKTGKTIQWLQLQDQDISASDLRKRLRVGQNVQKYLPLAVENYIKEQGLYRNLGEKIKNFEEFTQFCAEQLSEKKALGLRGFDVQNLEGLTDFTLVGSGTSTKHTSSLAENLIQAVKQEFNVLPQAVEGLSEGRWIVVDYGSLMVHVFYDFVRQEYKIEHLWKDARELKFEKI